VRRGRRARAHRAVLYISARLVYHACQRVPKFERTWLWAKFFEICHMTGERSHEPANQHGRKPIPLRKDPQHPRLRGNRGSPQGHVTTWLHTV
jgi:hypothetical protein